MSYRDIKYVLAAWLALAAPARRCPRQRRHAGFAGTTR